MPPLPYGGGIKRCFCLTSVWRLSDVWRRVAYVGPNSRTESPRKTKIGIEVDHITRDSDTTFKVKRSKVSCCWCLKWPTYWNRCHLANKYEDIVMPEQQRHLLNKYEAIVNLQAWAEAYCHHAHSLLMSAWFVEWWLDTSLHCCASLYNMKIAHSLFSSFIQKFTDNILIISFQTIIRTCSSWKKYVEYVLCLLVICSVVLLHCFWLRCFRCFGKALCLWILVCHMTKWMLSDVL